MATYLVIKRFNEDRVYMPGERLVDPANAEILAKRGYLVLAVMDPDQQAQSEAPRLPTVEEGLAAGYSQEAAEQLAAGEWTALAAKETKKIDQELSEGGPDDPELIEAAGLLGLTVVELEGLTVDEVKARVSSLDDNARARWEELSTLDEVETKPVDPAPDETKASSKKSK